MQALLRFYRAWVSQGSLPVDELAGVRSLPVALGLAFLIPFCFFNIAGFQ